MAKKKSYDFGEKISEYSPKLGREVPVWKSPKYDPSKRAAIAVIEKYDNINEEDFWILKNETKTGKMGYSGIIISHNACLKINDAAKPEDKFRPECISVDKDGFNGSLAFTYMCPEQGIYEVGEVSKANCKQNYPYAMALKRCMDRVILKISKIAFDGIYSDSEADEFREPQDEGGQPAQQNIAPQQNDDEHRQELINEIKRIAQEKNIPESYITEKGDVPTIEDLHYPTQMESCIEWLKINF